MTEQPAKAGEHERLNRVLASLEAEDNDALRDELDQLHAAETADLLESLPTALPLTVVAGPRAESALILRAILADHPNGSGHL